MTSLLKELLNTPTLPVACQGIMLHAAARINKKEIELRTAKGT
jgi:hypothetical protein